MSRIRLYVDEDSMSRALIQALVVRGVDVVTALGAEMIERPDEEQLDWATAQGRVLYSFNVADFYQLHTQLSAIYIICRDTTLPCPLLDFLLAENC